MQMVDDACVGRANFGMFLFQGVGLGMPARVLRTHTDCYISFYGTSENPLHKRW